MKAIRFVPALIALTAFAPAAFAVCNGVASSASYCMQQTTLNGGGTTSVSPVGTNFRLTASIGQESVIGVSSSPNYVLQSGFWSYYGSGLVPVLLTVHKNGVTPANPDLSWTGNNPNYSVYRLAGTSSSAACSTVFGNLLTTVTPQAYTDAAPPAQPLTCYSVLATAPGPTPQEGTEFSPNTAGSLDPTPGLHGAPIEPPDAASPPIHVDPKKQ
jgi:hypothetical protein